MQEDWCGAEPPEAIVGLLHSLFRHHRRHSSSRSCTSRSLFASPSCSVHLDRRFDHPQSLTRLFLCCITRSCLITGTGAHTSLLLKHSSIPRILHPPLQHHHLDLAGTRRDYLSTYLQPPSHHSYPDILRVICSTSYPHRPFVSLQ